MKKKGLTALLLIFVIMMSVMASACNSAPKTIEEYINKDKDAMAEVQKAADSSGLTVDFKGNDVIYTYDLAGLDGVTEEVVKTEYETVYPDGTLRKTPLPYLDIIDGVGAEPLVSDSTAAKVSSLTGGSQKAKKTGAMQPYIFEEDLVSPDGGDAYLLFEILKTSFVTKK